MIESQPQTGIVARVQPEELKRELALLLEEKRRRIRENGIKYYTPLEYQIPFHQSKKRIRLALGGNRSGKSVSGACEAVWYATGTHPYKSIPVPNFGRVICTDFTNGIEKVILPEIKKWLPKNAIAGYHVESRTLTLHNGSTIEFMSYDQDVEKFESASRHWIWFDEEPRQDIFNACQMRILDTKGDIWMTMTPTKGMTWVYSELYEQVGINPNIECFHYNTYDNPFVDRETIDEITRGFSEQEKEARLQGKFIQMSGLVYREYKQDIHQISRFPMPYTWQRICSIDPHPRISTAVLYMAVAPLNEFINVCKEHNITLNGEMKSVGTEPNIYIVYDEIFPTKPVLISDMVDLMNAHEGKDFISYRLIDNSAQTPDPILGKTIRDEFASHGIRTILADKNVPDRIFKVRERLQTNTMYFFGDLPEMSWEIRHYAWDDYKIGRDYKDPKEKPRKKRDHMMDNLGYMVLSSPKSNPPKVYRPSRSTICKSTGY